MNIQALDTDLHFNQELTIYSVEKTIKGINRLFGERKKNMLIQFKSILLRAKSVEKDSRIISEQFIDNAIRLIRNDNQRLFSPHTHNMSNDELRDALSITIYELFTVLSNRFTEKNIFGEVSFEPNKEKLGLSLSPEWLRLNADSSAEHYTNAQSDAIAPIIFNNNFIDLVDWYKRPYPILYRYDNNSETEFVQSLAEVSVHDNRTLFKTLEEIEKRIEFGYTSVDLEFGQTITQLRLISQILLDEIQVDKQVHFIVSSLAHQRTKLLNI